MKPPSKSTANGKNANGAIPNDRSNGLNTGKIISEAQHIVSTAVGVLEKEVAAGIVAAKKLEKKFIDVEDIRSNDPSELMNRIRQDAYAVVDLLLDAVNIVVHQLDNLSENLDKVPKAPAAPKPSGHIPMVKNEGAATAGSTVEVPFLLRNDSAGETMTVALNSPELRAPNGSKILARHIKIPDALALKPGEEREVIIQVGIPKSTAPGTYSGLFQDKNDTNLCAVLLITVA